MLLVWAVATACNLTKAVHIDDPIHLYAARNILSDPLQPYASQIHWGAPVPGPMNDIAHPPLFFYFLAMTWTVFGKNELAFHALTSLFTLGSLVCFYQIIALYNRPAACFSSLLLFLSPAFLPSQNLMLDVPLLFFCLLFFYSILRRTEDALQTSDVLAAGAAATAAFLTKYSGIVLLPILFVAVLLRGTKYQRTFAIIPLLVFCLWGLVSYLSLNEIHFAQRPLSELGSRVYSQSLEWFIALGYLAPFSILFLPDILRRKTSRAILVTLVALSLLWHPELLTGPITGSSFHSWLAKFFLFNGAFTTLGTLAVLVSTLRTGRVANTAPTPQRCNPYGMASLLFLLWFVGTFLFIIVFAKFIAVRYLLLILPVVVFSLSMGSSAKQANWLRSATLLLTVSLGLVFAVADWSWADVYRQHARKIADSYARDVYGTNTKIWAVGHWGWQWYAEQNGMKNYNWLSDLTYGDVIVVPNRVQHYSIHPDDRLFLKQIAEQQVPCHWLSCFRTQQTNPWGGMYSLSGNTPLLAWKRSPAETFSIYIYQAQPIDLPSVVLLNPSHSGEAQFYGFHEAEYWGRWTSAPEATITLSAPLPKRFSVRLQARPAPGRSNERYLLTIGGFQKEFQVRTVSEVLEFNVDTNRRYATIRIESPVESLAQISNGLDDRTVGFGLERMEFGNYREIR